MERLLLLGLLICPLTMGVMMFLMRRGMRGQGRDRRNGDGDV